jgi:hypothetical protein
MLTEINAKARRAGDIEREQEMARRRAHVMRQAVGAKTHFDPHMRSVETPVDASKQARISPTMRLIESPADQAAEAQREARDAAERERLRAERAEDEVKIAAVAERHRREDKPISVLGVRQRSL